MRIVERRKNKGDGKEDNAPGIREFNWEKDDATKFFRASEGKRLHLGKRKRTVR